MKTEYTIKEICALTNKEVSAVRKAIFRAGLEPVGMRGKTPYQEKVYALSDLQAVHSLAKYFDEDSNKRPRKVEITIQRGELLDDVVPAPFGGDAIELPELEPDMLESECEDEVEIFEDGSKIEDAHCDDGWTSDAIAMKHPYIDALFRANLWKDCTAPDVEPNEAYQLESALRSMIVYTMCSKKSVDESIADLRAKTSELFNILSHINAAVEKNVDRISGMS